MEEKAEYSHVCLNCDGPWDGVGWDGSYWIDEEKENPICPLCGSTNISTNLYNW